MQSPLSIPLLFLCIPVYVVEINGDSHRRSFVQTDAQSKVSEKRGYIAQAFYNLRLIVASQRFLNGTLEIKELSHRARTMTDPLVRLIKPLAAIVSVQLIA